jgi:DNA-binding NarL/FixJ family response regulator
MSPVGISVAIIDSHPLVREGLRAIVAAQDDLTFVAEAGDARAGYAAVDEARPDLVLLDLALPGADGLIAARELRRRSPALRMLMLSTRVEEHSVADALTAGVLGYVGKDQPIADLLLAMRTVGQGNKYLPPQISAERVASRMKRGDKGPLGMLSTREREVFDLLVRGFGNEQVAGYLGISRRTVETHRSRILKKLHVHSAVELIGLAARHSLITS